MASILNSIWQSLVVTLIVAMALRLARGLNASTRYAIWWITLGATVALFVVNVGVAVFPRSAPTQPVIEEVRSVPQPSPTLARVEEPTPVSARSPSPVSRFEPLQIRVDWVPQVIEVLWIGAALLMMARVGFGILFLIRIRTGAAGAPEVYLGRMRALIRACGLKRSVGFGVSENLRTPVAAGLYRPKVLIPSSLIGQLTEDEFDQVAIHELAHLRRWDDWANLIQRLIGALFVFHPAIWFINRKLNLEREIACDDFVLEQTGRARDYAACLTRLVEVSGWARQTGLAPGATLHKSHIVRRVEQLLNRRRNARPVVAGRAVWVVTVVLVLLVLTGTRVPALFAFANENGDAGLAVPPLPMLPAVPTIPRMQTLPTVAVPTLPRMPVPPLIAMAAPAGQSYSHYESMHNDDHIRVRWTQNGRDFAMDVQGDVVFTDDDHDVKSLSPGGWFRMEEQGSPDRRYEVRADGSGTLTRTYFENGHSAGLNEDGRRWLSDRLPQMIRETGAGAVKRVQRILNQRGPDGVVAEIRLIRSDGSKRIYLEEFLLHGNLDQAHLRNGIVLARGISSDGEKAALLKTVGPLYLKDGLRADLFDTVGTISSDGEHARVLAALVEDEPGNRDTLLLSARSAGKISSDGEKARLLVTIASHYRGNEAVRGAWFDTLNGVSSDGEKARAISAIIAQDGQDRDTLVEALKSVSLISSAGEKSQVLVNSSGFYIEDPVIRRNFFAAVDTISSDGERRRVLSEVYQRGGRNAATVERLLRSAEGISSAGEKAAVLSEIAGPMVSDPAVMDAFFKACDSISSDGEASRVLTKVIERGVTSPPALIRVIASAERISSDGEKSRVLEQVIRVHSQDSGVKAALRKSLDSVHSDGEYRKLATALSNAG